MVTFDELLHAQFDHLRTQADDWRKAVAEVDRIGVDFQRDVRTATTRAGWHGFVADIADGDIETIGRQLSATRMELQSVVTALDHAVQEFSGHQTAVRQVVQEAESAGYRIGWNGSTAMIVSPAPPDGVVLTEAEASAVNATMDGYRSRIDAAVRAATDADAKYAAILAAVRPDEIRAHDRTALANASADLRTASGMPADPGAVSAWWNGLDPVTRAQLYATDPEALLAAGVFSPGPWNAPDGGSGPHGSRSPSAGDRTFEAVVATAAAAAPWVGLPNAGRGLDHYLDNSGEPLEIDVDRMMRDAPDYRKSIETELLAKNEADWRRQALDAYASSGGAPVAIPVRAKDGLSVGESDSLDWFRAVGSNMTEVNGVVRVTADAAGNPKVTMDYQVTVRDRYNWDHGKGITIGPVSIEDKQMGSLHQAGLAQEYDIYGTSSTQSRTLNGSGAPPIPAVDDRDTTREDPDRGSVDGRGYGR